MSTSASEEDNLGDVVLDETGLHLPLLNSEEDSEDASETRPITDEDLTALNQVEAELNQRWNETQIEPSLDRINLLMDLLGEPHKAFPTIHVAGTNGKTSTVRMIESLLRAFHRRTGRTTSPHLQIVTERIGLDGEPIHPQDYVRIWEEIKPFVEMVDAQSEAEGGPKMSKFEVLTAIAYAAFADAPVDIAVVETGMGGTWDATNVINADVNVITPIAMDHMDYLGDTLEDIAAEKAGIIKSRWDSEDLLTPPDNVAVIGQQEPEVMNVLLEQVVATDTAVLRAGSEYDVQDSTVAVGGQQLTLQGVGGEYENIFLPLSGQHQAENAATALVAVEAFFGAGPGRPLNIDAVRQGFATVSSPGRLERVASTPNIFVDASHNPQGGAALAEALGRDFSFDRLIGVVGMLEDKDARGFLSNIESALDEIVITQPDSPRARDAYDLADMAREIFGEERVYTADNLASAVENAREIAQDSTERNIAGTGIIVTGSVVLAGQGRELFGKKPA